MMRQTLYTLFTHPLSSIPNASILAPISRLFWALPSEFRGRITLDLPHLHELYGKNALLTRNWQTSRWCYSISIHYMLILLAICRSAYPHRTKWTFILLAGHLQDSTFDSKSILKRSTSIWSICTRCSPSFVFHHVSILFKGMVSRTSHVSWQKDRDSFQHSQRRRLMGQLFNLSKIGALEGMMTENVTSFVQALEKRVGWSIEVVRACRALEADIVCE